MTKTTKMVIGGVAAVGALAALVWYLDRKNEVSPISAIDAVGRVGLLPGFGFLTPSVRLATDEDPEFKVSGTFGKTAAQRLREKPIPA